MYDEFLRWSEHTRESKFAVGGEGGGNVFGERRRKGGNSATTRHLPGNETLCFGPVLLK